MITREHAVSATEFKATCLELMDEVARTGRGFVVTKHGRPVVTVGPVAPPPTTPWGYMQGTGRVVGDIVSPIADAWEMSSTDPLRQRAARKRR
jgi:prevent-host-death family protein